MPERDYKLVVLDWDGTVMDSIGVIVACAQESARDLDVPIPPDGDIRHLVGLPLSLMSDRLLPDHEDRREAWIQRYSHHWVHTFHHRLSLLPHAREAIEALAGRDLYLAVATGKSRRGLTRDFENTGLGPHFLASRTADESPAKPSPGMLLELMDELGVRAEQTLMVGDTSHDLKMANNASVDAVAVLSGSHPQDILLKHRPAVCLDHLGQLPDWLLG